MPIPDTLAFPPLHNNLRLQDARVRMSIAILRCREIEAACNEAILLIEASDVHVADPGHKRRIEDASAQARKLRQTLCALEETLAVQERF